MNRCHPRKPALVLTLLFASLSFALPPAAAQVYDQPQRIPPMAATAVPGLLRITAPPEVLLNGQPARLAPGARIRDRNNLLVLSGTLVGEDLKVRYTRDPLGLVHEVWILTAAEIAATTPPKPLPPAY